MCAFTDITHYTIIPHYLTINTQNKSQHVWKHERMSKIPGTHTVLHSKSVNSKLLMTILLIIMVFVSILYVMTVQRLLGLIKSRQTYYIPALIVVFLESLMIFLATIIAGWKFYTAHFKANIRNPSDVHVIRWWCKMGIWSEVCDQKDKCFIHSLTTHSCPVPQFVWSVCAVTSLYAATQNQHTHRLNWTSYSLLSCIMFIPFCNANYFTLLTCCTRSSVVEVKQSPTTQGWNCTLTYQDFGQWFCNCVCL